MNELVNEVYFDKCRSLCLKYLQVEERVKSGVTTWEEVMDGTLEKCLTQQGELV